MNPFELVQPVADHFTTKQLTYIAIAAGIAVVAFTAKRCIEAVADRPVEVSPEDLPRELEEHAGVLDDLLDHVYVRSSGEHAPAPSTLQLRSTLRRDIEALCNCQGALLTRQTTPAAAVALVNKIHARRSVGRYRTVDFRPLTLIGSPASVSDITREEKS